VRILRFHTRGSAESFWQTNEMTWSPYRHNQAWDFVQNFAETHKLQCKLTSFNEESGKEEVVGFIDGRACASPQKAA
jgi:hypothetical protein